MSSSHAAHEGADSDGATIVSSGRPAGPQTRGGTVALAPRRSRSSTPVDGSGARGLALLSIRRSVAPAELHQRPKARAADGAINHILVQAYARADDDATLTRRHRARRHLSNTIEIELAEGMAGDDQNRILIIPWTPPSPHRRREIIQGEGERPCAMGPMRTEARALVIDALRDAHHWLDELTTSSRPNHRIARRARRQN